MAYYKRIKASLASLAVTNDSAERAVKLIDDKLGSALLEERFQNITQVVEKDRAAFPQLRKPNKN